MKKTNTLKSLVLSMAVAGAASVAVVPAATQAGVSANVGVMSTYIYRGVNQVTDAAASAGLDYEADSGFYLGVWGADVGGGAAGLEYDVYAGWAGEFEGVSLGLGATTYQYTGTFDTSYNEINLSLGYGAVEVGYAAGTHEKGRTVGASKVDRPYSDMYISAGYEGFSATYGVYDPDTNSAYTDDDVKRIELGYAAEITKGLEGSVTLVNATQNNVADKNDLVFGLTYSFDVM